MGARRHVVFRDRAIPIEVRVDVGSYSEYREWFKRQGFGKLQKREPSGIAHLPESKGPTLNAYIWLRSFRRGDPFDAGTLAHEALHMAGRATQRLGMEDEEVLCYVTGWIVEEATRRLTTR